MNNMSKFVKNTGIVLSPDCSRVIVRPHIPVNETHLERVISRVLSLDESAAKKELDSVLKKFAHRHHNLTGILERQFDYIRRYMPTDTLPSEERKLLIGSYFWSEYTFESVALFNPSIVPHPDQSGVPAGSLRFILSLRATGEGHISSLEFRTGIIDADNGITIEAPSSFATAAEMKANILYNKMVFTRKLREMSIFSEFSNAVMSTLPEEFTYDDLIRNIKLYTINQKPMSLAENLTAEKIEWLAQCNYETHFDPTVPLSERVIFPLSPSEQNGIEDARFVRFVDDDGSVKYYATYTAYDGKAILPQIMVTENFEHFKMITLNGNAAENKGMALFPRRINGHYAMISRRDSENLFLMYSDFIHFWHDTVLLMRPSRTWEFVNIGNCGSPIETGKGWILLTHGVGAFRQYSISAVLLDRDDPSRVIGRLREPLIEWTEESRSGYVPNVVYTCGVLMHNDVLVVPYAMSDQLSTIAIIPVPALLEQLLQDGVA